MGAVRSSVLIRTSTEEYQRALAVSSSLERVDASILLIISQVFSSANDRRVINGNFFLSHFLRLAQIKQISLFSGCDVAIVSVKSVRDLCTNPADEWPFSYETTSKYLRVLCALGVFCKPTRKKGDPVIYHFPLRPFVISEDRDSRLLALTKARNRKVCNSLALQRILPEEHDNKSLLIRRKGSWENGVEDEESPHLLSLHPQNNPPSFPRNQKKQIVDSFSVGTAQRLQVAAIAVRDVLQQSGITVPTGALSQIVQAMSQVFLSENSRSLPKDLSSTSAKRGSKKNLVDSTYRKSTRVASAKPEATPKFPSFSENLPTHQKEVDSMTRSPTEFSNVFYKKDLSEIKENTEFNGIEDVATGKVDFLPTQNDLQVSQSIQHDAATLSFLFEGNDSSIGHYTRLLREDAKATRLAVIDAWIRSKWPDKGYKRMELKGGWVTSQYKKYHVGVMASIEIQVWAETEYSYMDLKMAFNMIDSSQQSTLRPGVRPLPREVIIPSEILTGSSFWEGDAARGLVQGGYFCVDIEGDLVSCTKYERMRLEVIEQLSFDLAEPVFSSCLVSAEHERQELLVQMSEEVRTYLGWIQPQICTPKKIAKSCKLPDELVDDIECLEAGLDPSYRVQAYTIPFYRHLVIGIYCEHDRRQQWFLRGPDEVKAFLDTYSGSTTQLVEMAK